MKTREILVLSLFSLSLIACDGGKKSEDEKKKEEPPIPVETALVITGPIEASYRGTATLEAQDEATVVAKTSGIVEKVFFEEGQKVTAGQTLAKLETDRLRLEAGRAKSNLEKLESDFNRNKSVYQRNLISREAFDRTKYDLDGAKAAYDLAALALRESEIKAPISGVISSRDIKLGNMIQSGSAAFKITKLDELEAIIFVPERDIHKLSDDQIATLHVDAWPDKLFTGKVARINPVVDPTTGTVRVTVALSKDQPELKPGMFGRIEIQYDRKDNAVLVDRDAVLNEDGIESVFVINEEKATRKVIKTGYADSDHYEILGGLEAGDEVVITGQSSLKDGAKILVVGALARPKAEKKPEAPEASTSEK